MALTALVLLVDAFLTLCGFALPPLAGFFWGMALSLAGGLVLRWIVVPPGE